MVQCCVPYCNNRNDVNKTISYYRFPLDEDERRRWVKLIRRKDFTPNHNSRVCGWHFPQGKAAGPTRFAWNESKAFSDHGSARLSHFVSSPLSQPAYETLDTDQDWAPSLHLGYTKPTDAQTSNTNTGIKRSKLQVAKQRRSLGAPFFVQSECCVVKCGGRSHNDRGQRIRNGLTFHSFPIWRKNDGVFLADLSKRRRAAWVEAVGRVDITFDDIPDDAKICSRHFLSGKPVHDMMEKDPDWVPSLLMSNGKPPFIRKKSVLRKPKEAKKKRPRTVPDRGDVNAPVKEKPSAPQWKDLKSRLQELMMEEEQPTETPPVVVEDSLQNFKDFFHNSLKASLDACLDSDSQLLTESRPSLDSSWFSAPEKSHLSAVCASSVSAASCENCVRLQERIAELEERLAAPQFIRSHSDYSKWAPSFSLSPDRGRLSPSPKKKASAPEAKFHMDWLTKYWFLRYTPKQNVMWCYVCRLYRGSSRGRSTFVKGTRTFHSFAIEQHIRSSYHIECTRKFEARKASAKSR